jgi:hypothetical protein
MVGWRGVRAKTKLFPNIVSQKHHKYRNKDKKREIAVDRMTVVAVKSTTVTTGV